MASKEKKQPEKQDNSSKSEIMHRLKTHPFLFIGTVVVLVIVVVAFVFVPAIVPNTQGGGDLVFGYYNKAPIKYVRDNYFYNTLQNYERNRQRGSDEANDYYMMYMIWSRAYQDTIIHMGMLDEMKQAGYIAPESVIDREVAKQFQENGKFSVSRYRSLDNSTRRSIWRQVNDSVTTTHYARDLLDIKPASGEASFVSAMASPQRTFELAVFPFSSYPDSEVISYTKENAALFRITHLSKITITSGEKEAQQILDSVKNGVSTFEEAVKTNSQDEYAEKDGDMGIKMAHELSSEISDEQAREKIINLPKGSLSDLVQVSSGWAFFRAEEAVQAMNANDITQIDRVRNYIMRFARGRAEDWLVAEAEIFCARVKATNLDTALFAGNITKRSFGPIPLNYGDTALFNTIRTAGIPELERAGTSQAFWKAAFNTSLKSPSNPFVFEENVIVLFPVEESSADENTVEFIEMYHPYRISENFDNLLRTYFITNEKLDNRFDQTFGSIWGYN